MKNFITMDQLMDLSELKEKACQTRKIPPSCTVCEDYKTSNPLLDGMPYSFTGCGYEGEIAVLNRKVVREQGRPDWCPLTNYEAWKEREKVKA
jgi:hypothetical protein